MTLIHPSGPMSTFKSPTAPLACLAFLAEMGLASPVCATEVKVRVVADSTPDVGPGGTVGAITQTAASGVESEVANISLSGAGGRAVALSSLGVLKSSVTAGASRHNIFNGNASMGKAGADTSRYDTVTSSGAGLTGTGLSNVRLFVDASPGSVTNDGTTGVGRSFFATAAADFAFRANSVLFTFNTQAQLAQLDTDPINTFTRVNGLNYTGTLGGFWDLSVPFAFGQAFGLEAIITTSAFTLAGSNSTANSFANFGNSI